MKICYLDCISGISGDMTLGALVSCGVPPDHIETEIKKTGFKELFNQIFINGKKPYNGKEGANRF